MSVLEMKYYLVLCGWVCFVSTLFECCRSNGFGISETAEKMNFNKLISHMKCLIIYCNCIESFQAQDTKSWLFYLSSTFFLHDLYLEFIIILVF